MPHAISLRRSGPVERGIATPKALLVALIAAVFWLSGCSEGLSPRNPSVKLVSAVHRPTGAEIITTRDDQPVRFFSRENLRQTYFTGDTDPQLRTPPGGEPTGHLNVSALNTPGTGSAASEFQTEIETDDIYVEPLRTQQIIGGQWQPDLERGEAVSLSYTDEPLAEVAQDILGGILGVNYILSENITGNVTFRSERRFNRAELLQILSDILARNGYLIQYFNSVYHVGPPDELDTLTGLRGRTSLEGDDTYIIQLRNNAPDNIVEIAGALIPPGNTITAVPGGSNILVRGDPTQFRSIEELVRSLAGSGTRTNVLAIFPLRRSAPEVVTEQLVTIYEQRNLGEVLFLPLVRRQGVLAIAESQRVINDARRVVRGLDADNRDVAKLRVIPLTYLNAAETAAQLSEVFSSEASTQPTGGGGESFDSDVIRAAIDSASAGQSARGTTDSSGGSVSAPRFLRNGDGNGSAGDGSTSNASTPSPVETSAGVAIAADGRNNALLVRSTYEDFKRIQAAVVSLDVPLAQVIIEATIVEVTINDSLQYGVQAFLQRKGDTVRSAPVTGAADPGGAGFASVISWASGGTNIQTVLTALQSVSDVKVISSPYLTVADGATSRLSVGDQIPFVTASQTSSSNGSVTVTQEVEARDVGVILEVTPKVSADNSVRLDIVQEVSSTSNQASIAGSNPTVSQRTVESQITVRSGSTVLLGGLIQERSDITEDGVPVLRRIPLLGEAFKQRSDTQRRSELLILITPRVVRNNSQLTNLTDQLRWAITTRN